jgi:CRISPR-associated endonuclease/helicase Cas3
MTEIAHFDPLNKERIHFIDEHLKSVASLAEQFAFFFDSSSWANLSGLLHDIGKYSSAFQEKMRNAQNGETIHSKVDHKHAGAIIALQQMKDMGLPVAFAVAGHHNGLANKEDLLNRIKNIELIEAIPNDIVESIKMKLLVPTVPLFLQDKSISTIQLRCRFELWIRMLFSCLVDADFLDTEAFFKPYKSSLRKQVYPSVKQLQERCDKYIDKFSANVTNSEVNKARAYVLKQCREASQSKVGFFSLAVPTGGGKTLSAMSFALRHAIKNNLRRIIVVIPYTSIIEQNAETYRKALGSESIIEHHSAIESQQDNAHLAAENWDAPIIVTTTVQLFDSLFARKPSKCRKLHNLAKSVIILDEVQVLPPMLLSPILDVLQNLVECYGSSVIFSTATQPALVKRESLPFGIKNVKAIITTNDIKFPFRTQIKLPENFDQRTSWSSLATKVSKYNRVLVIVHRKRDAKILVEKLDQLLGNNETIHLSTFMCAEHRSEVIREIKKQLAKNKDIRVVSTQLIEAGVDIDFPVVFRAFAGLDSIVQAAGRCNREGKLKDESGNEALGQVEIFRAESDPPPGILHSALQVMMAQARGRNDDIDLFSDSECEQYFRSFYMTQSLDRKNIQLTRSSLQYKIVAEKFKMIDDDYSTSVIVKYNKKCERVLEDLERYGPSRSIFRRLQRFTINIPKNICDKAEQNGSISYHGKTSLKQGIKLLKEGYYDNRFGMIFDS